MTPEGSLQHSQAPNIPQPNPCATIVHNMYTVCTKYRDFSVKHGVTHSDRFDLKGHATVAYFKVLALAWKVT
jgi:hypothetical protein